MGFLQKIHIMSEVVQNTVMKKRQNALFYGGRWNMDGRTGGQVLCEGKSMKNTGKSTEKQMLFIFTNFSQYSQHPAAVFPKTDYKSVKFTKAPAKIHTRGIAESGLELYKIYQTGGRRIGFASQSCTETGGLADVKKNHVKMLGRNVHFPGLPLDFFREK